MKTVARNACQLTTAEFLKMRLLLLLCVFVFGSGTQSKCQEQVTLRSLLNEMVDYESVARWPKIPYETKQLSSYDRRSISPNEPGWFANDDFNQFIRSESKEGHIENVMMDEDGPGAIVRFWLTTVVKPGILRVYLDDNEKPSIVVPAFDMMKAGFSILGPALLQPHSSYDSNGKGGNTLYLPIPYQKHCKITWENTDTVSAKRAHYYQINFRTYPLGTKVTTFTMKGLFQDSEIVRRTELLLLHPPVYKNGNNASKSEKLTPNGAMSIELKEGAAVVRTIRIRLKTHTSADYQKAWRSVVLKIQFDGHETVNCPLGDFVGSGYGGKPIKSWYRTLNSEGELLSRWVMPYQKRAMITLLNNSHFYKNIDMVVGTSNFEFDSTSMYFNVGYKYEENIKDVKGDYDLDKIAKLDSAAPIDWNLALLKGRGVYMGNTLSVYNHMNAWYGEGDEKAYVDGQSFPSEFGTGLEDYYNTSWAPVVIYQTPFANAPRADNPNSFGYNTFTRTRNLDAIPFRTSFRYDLEMISWVGGTIDIGETVYWYGFENEKSNAIKNETKHFKK